jgi:peptide/nickel transport system substrate-binding protein
MNNKIIVILTLIFFLLLSACQSEKPEYSNRVVIGIPADVKTFNPLFALSVNEGAISELLFLSLIDFRWNDDLGEVEPFPLLAESWDWAEDKSSITFNLRSDVHWSDGESFTVDDVVFSLDVYSDPEVQSRLYGIFEDFYTNEQYHIDVENTFVIKSEYELQINFKPGSSPDLFDVVHPIIPKHIYEKYARKDLATAEANFSPVSNSPFILQKWDRNQTITFGVNKNSFLYDENNIDELIFKIIPDYTSRLTQLNKNEIDFMELISTEDVSELKEMENLKLETINGREYDYVGWNNIDPENYNKTGAISSNKFFGNREIRIALTHAINRKEILEEYLYDYGTLATTPVSPIFKYFVNPDLDEYSYDPERAEFSLLKQGWRDTNNDGVIDKNGIEFKFTLTFPGGNPLRSYAATIIKNNLKAVGIDVSIETMEMGAFIDNLISKRMDAWMAAWYIPIPIELKAFWYSDLQNTQMNFVSYQNSSADKIMDALIENQSRESRRKLYFEFQKIIHEDQPMTFMYWTPNIVGINTRIENVNLSPLGTITHCWEWAVTR